MNMHHIRSFVALCATLNFTRAALLSNVTQSALASTAIEAEGRFPMKITVFSKHKSCVAALLAVGGLGLAAPAVAQDHGHDLTRLGKVTFEVACNTAAQAEFNRGMALYHSFAWSEADAAFTAVAEADAACGMAHWGRAMVMLDNPFVWPSNLPPETLDAIAGAVEQAETAGLNSEREQDYVAALATFVRDRDTLDHRARAQALEEALGEIAASYSEDTEAAILHALVTSANFDPADKTYTNQMRAGEILEPLLEAHPDHPGVAHYMIHTFDYPPLAGHGHEAALRYSDIAPDATHALHMPSHIFTRLGQWEASIASNRASAEADGGATFYFLHAYDYMVYAHLQLAQDGAAREAMEGSLAAKTMDHFGAAFAYAAMPARLALERDDWKAAETIALRPSVEDYPWSKYPQAEAVNALARGIGAARSGDAAAAREQQARLHALRDAMPVPYWAEQIDIQADVVGALALCADGKTQDCIDALRQAAAREDATEKHVVTPGPILPARELLADTLLMDGEPGKALQEYEAVLAKEPNRYRAVAGAMQAAEMSGDPDKMHAHAAHLLEQAAEADSDRPSLAQAKRVAALR